VLTQALKILIARIHMGGHYANSLFPKPGQCGNCFYMT
jgi:hypothetical protein